MTLPSGIAAIFLGPSIRVVLPLANGTMTDLLRPEALILRSPVGQFGTQGAHGCARQGISRVERSHLARSVMGASFKP
jgi:hypothetical protein